MELTTRISALLVAFGVGVAPGSPATAGEIYRWVDSRGNVTYAYRPPQPYEVPGPQPAAETAREQAKPLAPPRPVRSGPATADELLELSGLKEQLGGLSGQIADQVRGGQSPLSQQDQATVARVLAQAFRPDVLYPLIRTEFTRNLDQTGMDAAATWYRSSPAMKITDLEIAASTAEGQQALAAWVKRLATEPPSAVRIALLARIDWTSGVTEMSADILLTVLRGIVKVFLPLAPSEGRPRPGQIERQLYEIRTQLVEVMRQGVIVTMAFTYRALSDEELEAYVRFLSSEAGHRHHLATRRSFLRAVGVQTERAMREIVRAVPPDRWAREATRKPPPAR